jgi:uncharacterized membrane protein YbhN (UPF0104 family)
MTIKTLLKFIVSGLLLYILVRTIELEEFQRVISKVSPLMVVLVVIGYMSGQLISVVKWWMILRGNEGRDTRRNNTKSTNDRPVRISLKRVAHAYFTGMFVNVLGIGTVGGDMTRAILVSDANHPKTMCLATVAADRAHGLVVLIFIGVISVALYGGNMLPLWMWLTLSVGGFGVILFWFFGPELLLRVVPESHHLRIKAEQLSRAIPRDPSTVLMITVLSIVFHLWQVGLHQGMAQALGVTVPWPTLLVSIPFVNVLSNLPISWQGLGVRENGYAFFLVPNPLDYEQALAMGVIWLFAVTSSGAIGGLLSLVLSAPARSTVGGGAANPVEQ